MGSAEKRWAAWYRHWLEIMRGGAGLVFLLTPVLIVADLIMTAILHARTGADTGFAGAAMTPEARVAFLAHLRICVFTALVMWIFMGDSGIRTPTFEGRHQSLYYTLTLPVSRFDLVWTRYAAGCGAAVLVFFALLLGDSLVALAWGGGVPFGAMALASVLGCVLLCALLAPLGTLMPLVSEAAGRWVVCLAVVFGAGAAGPLATRFVGSPAVPWMEIGWLILLIGASVSASAMVAQKRDF